MTQDTLHNLQQLADWCRKLGAYLEDPQPQDPNWVDEVYHTLQYIENYLRLIHSSE